MAVNHFKMKSKFHFANKTTQLESCHYIYLTCTFVGQRSVKGVTCNKKVIVNM